MSRPWILVTPASRGIGAALTAHLLRNTRHPILATTRASDPSTTKQELLSSAASLQAKKGGRDRESESGGGSTALDTDAAAKRLHVVRADVTDESTLEAAASTARDLFPTDGGQKHHLHLALAIPGVLLPRPPEKNPLQINADAALAAWRVNCLGPILLAKHFWGFLPRKATSFDLDLDGQGSEAVRLAQHATWVSMSARVGSVTDDKAGGWYAYRSSKAGVNSLMKSLDNHMRVQCGEKAMAMAYHPGTVKTGLSRDFWGSVPEGQLLSPEFAAERMVEVVTGMGLDGRGRCWDWKGEVIPP